MEYKSFIREIEDFPKAGVRFKDITTLMKNGEVYRQCIQEMAEFARAQEAEVIVGPEARGFVIGAPIAVEMGIGFVPVRKKGKLPAEVVQSTYQLEYGEDALAIHVDAISPGQKVVVADDLLATGGTINTTVSLIEQLGAEVVGCAFLIELTDLNGRRALAEKYPLYTLVQY